VISIAELTSRFPRPGRLVAIVLRPARRGEPLLPDKAELLADGLAGDHAPEGLRAVTLIQAEHLPVITSLSGTEVTPARLRRNLVVSGLNLAALKGVPLRLGPEAVVEITGPCPPCSRMEETLGLGGYNAMRGHGGWYAKVLRPGQLILGDVVEPVGPKD
jgi:MOSC domain-containing protein YiiM